jgi:hypothetical protein
MLRVDVKEGACVMQPIISGTGILLVCWFVAASAQQRTEVKEEPAHKVFVLNGCLESSDAPAIFRLTRASVVGQSPAPPPTRSAGAVSSPSQDVYELQPVQFPETGLKREELQSHVGRQVEVTIRPIEVPTPAPASPADSKAKPEPAAPQRYTVSKIGRLADSCGGK